MMNENQWKNNSVLDLIDKKENSSGVKTLSLAKISQVKLTQNAQVRGVKYALKITNIQLLNQNSNYWSPICLFRREE